MKIIDAHIHTIFRPTHFFENYRLMGVESVVSVAFYPIKPKYSETLEDLCDWMIEREPKRLQKVGISCYCGIGIHPRSIPKNLNPKIFKYIENCIKTSKIVSLGEIGLERGDKEEIALLEKQLILAKKNADFPVILHTPGRNKREITRKLIEILESIQTSVGIIDHVSPENIDLVLNTELHLGLTVQLGKLTPEKLLEIISEYEGETDRFILNSDLGIDIASKNIIPETVQQMLKEGIEKKVIEKIVHKNAENLFNIS